MTKRRKGYTVIPELARTREMPQDTRDDNVANLPHGNIDAVITSPPYSESLQVQANPQREMQRIKEKFSEGKLTGRESIRLARKGKFNPHSTINLDRRYSNSEGNIGNLPHGSVDAVITSPPYGEAQEGSGIAKRGYQGSKHSPTDLVGKRSYMPDKFQSPENISRLPLGNVDTVITSPPYEQGLGHNPGKKKITELGIVRPEYNWQNPNQIGSMQKETYLSAMLQVYSEMFRVLKPNGLAIIIVKPFIRNKRVVDLPWHTWLLMAKVGFTLEKLYKLHLKQQSFWRILQYKNNPHLERICHEYVIVAKKPTAA
jgi:DNA modification methylase